VWREQETSLDAVIAKYETSGKEWPGVLCS